MLKFFNNISLFKIFLPRYFTRHVADVSLKIFNINISTAPFVSNLCVLIRTSITCEELNINKDFESNTLSIFKNLYISLVSATSNFEFSGFLYGS